MTCMHGVERFADHDHWGGPVGVCHPTECRACDARDLMQAGVLVGMKVRFEEFNVAGIEGTVTDVVPCDGNCCEAYPHPNVPCDNDGIIIAEDGDSMYFRYQIGMVDA